MPAWKDADGGITLCAETEVGIRWVGLEEGEKQQDNRGVINNSNLWNAV